MSRPNHRLPFRALRAAILAAALILSAATACQDREPMKGDEMSNESRPVPAGKNRLALEKSPYLLQHADNPVDWYPWGDEAFAEAERRDKPVFLSIGYSTCHWCHVMEHESFEDEQVAALMNEHFVCVKVDREERPDIDTIYMSLCQMMTGRGGWPLTVLLTPDRRAFFTATYIPKAGMLDFIPKVADAWANNRERLIADSERLTEALRKALDTTTGDALGNAELQNAFAQLSARYDSTYAGFGSAPKFPSPHNLLFLLRHWTRTGEPTTLGMVERTLQRMRRGGMYDHVGFGFHRYSTDARWFLPHFEKMLYDQAMLAAAYTEAWQATGHDAYRRTAGEIFEYVRRDMTDPKGGFYSAEDADSEGEEGKFYLWSEAELRDVLGDDAELAMAVFAVEDGGNYTEEATGRRTGANILHLGKPIEEHASAMGISEDELRGRLEPIRRRLFEARESRVHPHKDDKILADWNGLMIAALAKAARAFDDPDLAARAGGAVRFVLEDMAAPNGRLYHRHRAGESAIPAMIDDYAFVVWGLLELYEATFDVAHLERAVELSRVAIEDFWDDDGGGFYFTADDGERLIVRPKEIYDGAVPSGNSMMMLNLVRLSRMTGDPSWEERAVSIGRAFQNDVSQAPAAYTFLMCGVDFLTGPSNEIVLVGKPDSEDVRAMAAALGRAYHPRKVVLFRPAEDADRVVSLAPFTKSQSMVDGRATAYVCRDFACELPTAETDEMLSLLGRD